MRKKTFFFTAPQKDVMIRFFQSMSNHKHMLVGSYNTLAKKMRETKKP
jgi:chemotaxis methyl-accepting protein methylase